jgi:hypothetical protein
MSAKSLIVLVARDTWTEKEDMLFMQINLKE